MKKMRKATQEELKIFSYLDDQMRSLNKTLQAMGATGHASILIPCQYDQAKAQVIFKLWLRNHNRDGNYQEIYV